MHVRKVAAPFNELILKTRRKRGLVCEQITSTAQLASELWERHHSALHCANGQLVLGTLGRRDGSASGGDMPAPDTG